jgi:hypothetical protein
LNLSTKVDILHGLPLKNIAVMFADIDDEDLEYGGFVIYIREVIFQTPAAENQHCRKEIEI